MEDGTRRERQRRAAFTGWYGRGPLRDKDRPGGMTERQPIRIVMEGAGAEAAARDFFSRGWFEAEWERREELGAAPVVSANVLAIAGGSVTVADKMIGWWESWQRQSEPATGLAVVVQVPGGARVALDAASRDSLVDVLRVLHAPVR